MSTEIDFCMPSLGSDMDAGKVTEWCVKVGDRVKRGDIVAVTGDGAPAIRSAALWVLGKAMTSRMLGSPANSITNRSMPGAIPPWGGVPFPVRIRTSRGRCRRTGRLV